MQVVIQFDKVDKESLACPARLSYLFIYLSICEHQIS